MRSDCPRMDSPRRRTSWPQVLRRDFSPGPKRPRDSHHPYTYDFQPSQASGQQRPPHNENIPLYSCPRSSHHPALWTVPDHTNCHTPPPFFPPTAVHAPHTASLIPRTEARRPFRHARRTFPISRALLHQQPSSSPRVGDRHASLHPARRALPARFLRDASRTGRWQHASPIGNAHPHAPRAAVSQPCRHAQPCNSASCHASARDTHPGIVRADTHPDLRQRIAQHERFLHLVGG